MAVISRKSIDDFYGAKRIAVVGASRSKHEYGRMLFEELLKRGYDAVPVNPNAEKIGGKDCYKSVKGIPGVITHAFIVLPPDKLEAVVEECAETGIKHVWMHEHVMKGVSNPKAIFLAEQKGLECIAGFCPMMFMPKTGFPHNIHAAILKVFKAYPV
ncbi:MAG TPA: CoA-binding protein [Firmicutes bacterium]|nr:CoA-binding protein [Bacillota bacterium]